MDIPDNIYTIIAKKLDGEASPAEVRSLEAWLQEAKSNLDTFSQLERLHHATGQYLQQPIDTAKAWNRLEEKLDKTSGVVEMNSRRSYRQILSIAAVLILVIGGGWLMKALFLSQSWEKVIAATANLEQRLPDGSLVSIRKGTTLEWRSDFANQREVKLNGEAFFDVQHNSDNKFTVTTPQSVTTVIGTAFTIRSRSGFDQVIVTRGKVNVAPVLADKPAALLLPGDKLVLSKDKLLRSSVSDSNFLAWKTGHLQFRDLSLVKVLRILSDFYQVSITVESKPAGDVPVTVSFDNEPIAKALEKISLLTGLEVSKQADGSWLYSKK